MRSPFHAENFSRKFLSQSGCRLSSKILIRNGNSEVHTRIMEFKGISFGLSTHTLIFWLKITLKIPLNFYQLELIYPYFSCSNDKIGYFSANFGHFSAFVAKTVQKYPYATQFLSTYYPYFNHNLEYSSKIPLLYP